MLSEWVAEYPGMRSDGVQNRQKLDARYAAKDRNISLKIHQTGTLSVLDLGDCCAGMATVERQSWLCRLSASLYCLTDTARMAFVTARLPSWESWQISKLFEPISC